MFLRTIISIVILGSFIQVAQAEEPSLWDEISAEFTKPRTIEERDYIAGKNMLTGAFGVSAGLIVVTGFASAAEEAVLMKMTKIPELEDAAEDVLKLRDRIEQLGEQRSRIPSNSVYVQMDGPKEVKATSSYFDKEIAQAKQDLKKARAKIKAQARNYFKSVPFSTRAKVHGGVKSLAKWGFTLASIACGAEVGIAIYCASTEDLNPPMSSLWTIGGIVLGGSPESVQSNAEDSTKGESVESTAPSSEETVTAPATHEEDTNEGS